MKGRRPTERREATAAGHDGRRFETEVSSRFATARPERRVPFRGLALALFRGVCARAETPCRRAAIAFGLLFSRRYEQSTCAVAICWWACCSPWTAQCGCATRPPRCPAREISSPARRGACFSGPVRAARSAAARLVVRGAARTRLGSAAFQRDLLRDGCSGRPVGLPLISPRPDAGTGIAQPPRAPRASSSRCSPRLSPWCSLFRRWPSRSPGSCCGSCSRRALAPLRSGARLLSRCRPGAPGTAGCSCAARPGAAAGYLWEDSIPGRRAGGSTPSRISIAQAVSRWPLPGYLGYFPFLPSAARPSRSSTASAPGCAGRAPGSCSSPSPGSTAADGFGRRATSISVAPRMTDARSLPPSDLEWLERVGLRTRSTCCAPEAGAGADSATLAEVAQVATSASPGRSASCTQGAHPRDAGFADPALLPSGSLRRGEAARSRLGPAVGARGTKVAGK